MKDCAIMINRNIYTEILLPFTAKWEDTSISGSTGFAALSVANSDFFSASSSLRTFAWIAASDVLHALSLFCRLETRNKAASAVCCAASLGATLAGT